MELEQLTGTPPHMSSLFNPIGAFLTLWSPPPIALGRRTTIALEPADTLTRPRAPRSRVAWKYQEAEMRGRSRENSVWVW